MKHEIIAIRDRAIDAFGLPAFVRSIGHGLRTFADQINKKETGNALNDHPEDFDLYHLGHYDEDSGRFESLDQPKQIAVGKSVYIKE